jgi:drug/metabolite transporter (DMT)-like permease
VTTSGPILDPAPQRRERLTGIGLMCGAVACFAVLDTGAKYLATQMDVLQVVWVRYTAAFLLTLAVFNPVRTPALMVTSRRWLQVGRALLLLGSTTSNFLALQYLQLDQALAITFSAPFLVAVLSGPLLGEWVGWRRWAAIGVGFAGVLLVTRPGFGGIHPAALLCFANAICIALYGITTRILARTDSNQTTLFYSNAVGAALMLPILPFVWTNPGSLVHVLLMLMVGAMGGLGHYFLIAGHRRAPASLLAPFMYSQIAWAMILGYLVFGDVPNAWTLAGAALAVGSGLYILHRERLRGPRSG